MTYLEKLMTAIRFDDEMLTADEIKKLRVIIRGWLCIRLCPSDIKFLQGPGPGPQHLRFLYPRGTCTTQCWDKEAAVNG